MNTDTILGIDVGGTGIKGAVVNTRTGELLTERVKVMTPKPATPKAVSKALRKLVDQIGWKGDYIGCGFPAIIKKQVAHSAANVHKNWIGTNVAEVFGKVVPADFFVLNDADAAGLAEMRMGAGKKCNGVALMITIGTGIGSALFSEKVLVPNSEVGHVLF
ncbi:MAG: ROK family protein, partial [Bacteroidetes bacterium]